jgi:predicted 3-demethylubiquinone-9 3-methyltransferase (glyoxalase superfamily)
MILEAPYDKSSNLPEGSLLFAQYNIGGSLINAMSSNQKHDYDFNEAVSLMVYCENQEEVNYYWEKFTHEGEEQPCGWLKDKYGVSWQIVPKAMDKMMQTSNKEQLARVTKAMLTMTKFDINKLQEAFDNR